MPTLTARASSPSHDGLDYDWSVSAGSSTSPGRAIDAATTGPSASGTEASWTPTSSLADGTYEYRVRAADGTIDGPWSGYFVFTVDTEAPAPPTLEVLSGTIGTGDSFSGTVGVTEDALRLSSAAGSLGYVYAIQPHGGDVSFPADLQCDSSTAGYITVCPGRASTRVVDVTAPADTFTFAAETFDAAGNVSAPVDQTFDTLHGDYAASGRGHSWLTAEGRGTSGDCRPSPIPDSADKPGRGLQWASHSHACWEYSAVAPSQNGSPPQFGFRGDGIEYLDGRRSEVATSTVIDPTANFTVGAWVRPAKSLTDAYVGPIISEKVDGSSAFTLGVSRGTFRFCVEHADRTDDCASSGGVGAGRWVYVAGVYDRVDDLLMIYVLTGPYGVGDPDLGVHPADTPSAAPAAIEIGNDETSNGPTYWNGEILDPAVFQGVADSGQLSGLAGLTAPADLRP